MAAVGVFVLLGVVVALGHWYETQRARAQPLPLRPTVKAVLVHVTTPATEDPAPCAKPCSSSRPQPAHQYFDRVPKINLETALRRSSRAWRQTVGSSPGAQIDAQGARAGPVFDVSGPNTRSMAL